MGKLIKSEPQGEAATVIDYHTQSVPFVVDLKMGPASAPLEQRKWTLDGLGRIVRAEIGMPAGGRSVSVVAYNALGWKLFDLVPRNGILVGVPHGGSDAAGDRKGSS